MNKQTVLLTDFQTDLTNRFQKRLALDIPRGSADLGYYHIGVCFLSDGIDEGFDFIRDMRDHLNRLTEIFTVPFFIQDIPVNLAGR